MSISFEGIGQWCATFACEGMKEGAPVKMAENDKVGICGDGEDFCGVAVAVGHDGKACGVQMGGFVTLPYSGSDPAVGMTALVGDGAEGVKIGGEKEYLVVNVDGTAKTVIIKL